MPPTETPTHSGAPPTEATAETTEDALGSLVATRAFLLALSTDHRVGLLGKTIGMTLWSATEGWAEGREQSATIAQISEQIGYTLGSRTVHPDRKAITQALNELEAAGYVDSEGRHHGRGPGRAPTFKMVRRTEDDPLTQSQAPFHVWHEPEPESASVVEHPRRAKAKTEPAWMASLRDPALDGMEPLPDPLEWALSNIWSAARDTSPSPLWAGAVAPSPLRRAIHGECPDAGTAVVYVLYADLHHQFPIYLGSTGNLRQRLREHARDGKEFVGWRAHRCEDRRDAYLVERALLQEPTLLPMNGRRR